MRLDIHDAVTYIRDSYIHCAALAYQIQSNSIWRSAEATTRQPAAHQPSHPVIPGLEQRGTSMRDSESRYLPRHIRAPL